MTRISKRRLYVVFALALVACTPKNYRLEANLVFPPPPEKPRLRYVDSFLGDSYFAGGWSTAFMNSVLGEDVRYALNKPMAVTADDRGNVYVSDNPGTVMVLDREHDTVRLLADRGQAKVFVAGGLAIHNARRELYVCDIVRQSVSVINADDNTLLRTYANEFSRPVGLAIDEARDLLAVADIKAHVVLVLEAKTGKVVRTIGGRGKGEGQLYFPIAVAYAPNGNLFVSDEMNFRVQQFDTEGNFVSSYGTLGVDPGQFARPKGVAVDSEGHLYVVDAAFGNIQVFDIESGTLLLVIGHNGAGPGEFSLPYGLFMDASNHLYVVDQLNRRVQRFEYLSKRSQRDSEGGEN